MRHWCITGCNTPPPKAGAGKSLTENPGECTRYNSNGCASRLNWKRGPGTPATDNPPGSGPGITYTAAPGAQSPAQTARPATTNCPPGSGPGITYTAAPGARSPAQTARPATPKLPDLRSRCSARAHGSPAPQKTTSAGNQPPNCGSPAKSHAGNQPPPKESRYVQYRKTNAKPPTIQSRGREKAWKIAKCRDSY